MTLIHGNSATARGRPEDSTALQRRLLQDLERQWLDTWGRADQVQAQVNPSDAKPMPADDSSARTEKTVAGVAAAVSPRLASPVTSANPALHAEEGGIAGVESSSPRAERIAMGVAREPSGVAHMPQVDGSGVAASDKPRQNDVPVDALVSPTAERGPAMAGRSTTAGVTAEAGVASEAPARTDPAKVGEQAWRSTSPGREASRRPSAMQVPESPHRAEPKVGGQANVSHALAGNWLAQAASTPIEPEASMGAASVNPGSTALKLTGVSAYGARPSTPPTEGREGETKSAKASPPRTSTASSELKPTRQHLMLRELSEQEVLASMRDVQLGSHESQLAAQGLARALMQAGYARVQVVVNGHQQLQDDALQKDDTTPDTALTATETSNSQSVRHGY